MPATPPPLLASGNIYPCRFVTVSGAHAGAQAGANARILGIARNETNYPPITDPRITVAGYHAVDGEPIRMLGDGEVGLVEAGAAITAGDRLKSDSNGKAVPIATTGNAVQEIGAVAIAAATTEGELILVQCQPGATYIPN